jgi:hypothetical protein
MRSPARILQIFASVGVANFAYAFTLNKCSGIIGVHSKSALSLAGRRQHPESSPPPPFRSAATSLRMASKAPPAFKGFGKAPEDPTDRAPKSADEPCVCESGKAYKDCCQPFHTGQAWPGTPEQLMRSRSSPPPWLAVKSIIPPSVSQKYIPPHGVIARRRERRRYSAYAYRLPRWIMDTTHRTNVDWRADSRAWQARPPAHPPARGWASEWTRRDVRWRSARQ